MRSPISNAGAMAVLGLDLHLSSNGFSVISSMYIVTVELAEHCFKLQTEINLLSVLQNKKD